MHSTQEETRRQHRERGFATFGIEWVCYVKPTRQDGHVAYTVHGADGTQIGQFSDRAVAEAATRQHDLEPVSVH